MHVVHKNIVRHSAKVYAALRKPQGADRLHEQKQHARTAVSAIAFALRPESLRHCRIPSMNLTGAGGCVAMFASVAVIAHLQ